MVYKHLNPVIDDCYGYLENVEQKHVRIDKEKLERVAETAVREKGLLYLPNWKVDPNKEHTKKVYPDDDWSKENVIDFLGVVNSINFCFWTMEGGNFSRYQRNGVVGSNAMFSVVKQHFNRLKPSRLIRDPLRMREMWKLFGNLSMLNERKDILNQIGQRFSDYGIDSFSDFFKHRVYLFGKDSKIFYLQEILSSFDDYSVHTEEKGKKVYVDTIQFNKRAQLFFAMVYERLGDLVDIRQTHLLSVFADYQVPKSLWSLGILNYSVDLQKKILNNEIIPRNSKEEIEIRANTVVACHKFTEKVNNLFLYKHQPEKYITNLNTDAYFWYMGTKTNDPYHLTRTTAY